MIRPGPPLRAQGFTLVEAMVALTILGVGLALLFSGLRLGARTWEATGTALETHGDLQLTRGVVGDLLASVTPLVTEREGVPGYWFRGTPDAVRFAAYRPPYPDHAGLYLLALTIRPAGDGGQELRLSRAHHAAAGDPDDAAMAEDVPVLRSKQAMAFDYFGAADAENEARWVADWDASTALPRLVRLRFGTAEEGTAPWPALVFRLAVDADLSCLNAAISGPCTP